MPSTVAQPKAVKEKKAKVSKPKKAKTVSHPPYFQMIKEAIMALKEKGGSSPYAIAKYMEEKHKSVLPVNFRKMLALQLKNQAARGKLIKIKASYKLSEAAKVTKKPVAKKTKPSTAKKTEKAKKVKKAVKKVVGVKKAKKPSKSAKPKSLKKPATKRPRKVTASAS